MFYVQIYEETYESINFKLQQEEEKKIGNKTSIPEGKFAFQTFYPVFRIEINWIRIQTFVWCIGIRTQDLLDSDPDTDQGFLQILEIFAAELFLWFLKNDVQAPEETNVSSFSLFMRIILA